MTIELRWDTEYSQILWQVFEGKWTLDDYIRSYEEFGEILSQCDFTVYVICDMRQSAVPPAHLLSIARHVENKLPENRGAVAIVGGASFLKMILKIGARIMPRYTSGLYSVQTIREAYEILEVEMNKRNVQEDNPV